MKFWGRPAVFLFILGFFILLLASPGLNGPFILDDLKKIVDNPDIKQISNLPTRLIFQPELGEQRLFTRNDPSRPVVYLTYTLDYFFYGLNALGFRVFNFFIHFLCCVFIFFITRKWTTENLKNQLWPYILTIVFALHPISVTSFLYVFKRSDLLGSFFILTSVWVFISDLRFKEKLKVPIMGFLFLLAVFSKQSAIVLPAIILAVDYFLKSGGDFALIKKNKNIHLGLWGLAAGILIFRKFYFGGIGDIEAQITWDTFNYVMIQPWILFRYFEHLLFPVHLSIDHDIKAINFWSDPRLYAGWVLVLSVFFLLYRLVRNRNYWRLETFGILWFFLLLLPTSSFFPTTTPLDDNRIYLSSFGFFLAVFSGLDKINIKGPIKQIGCLVLILFFSVMSFRYASLYRDPIELWKQSGRQYPTSYRALVSIGNEYYLKKDYNPAAEYYETAINLNSELPEPLSNLGNIYFLKGDFIKAEKAFQSALSVNPNFVPALTNIAQLYIQMKNFEAAEAHLKRAIIVDSGYALAHNNMGILYLETNRLNEAQSAFGKAIELDPNNLNAVYNLGLVSIRLGDKSGALVYFKKVVEVNPSDLQAKAWVAKLEQ